MGLLISSFVWRSLASDCIPSSQKVCWETLVLYLMLNVCATLCLSLRRRVTTYSGILSVLINILWVGIKWMEPCSIQQCLATEQGEMGTNWNTGSSIQTRGRTSLLQEWGSTGKAAHRGCGILFYRISFYESSRLTWILSCATYCREPVLAEELDQMINRGPFQSQCFSDSLK